MVACQSTSTHRLLLIGLARPEVEASSALFILSHDDRPRRDIDNRFRSTPGRAKHTPRVGIQHATRPRPCLFRREPEGICLLQTLQDSPQARPSILRLLSWLRLVSHESASRRSCTGWSLPLLIPEANPCYLSLLQYSCRDIHGFEAQGLLE